MKRCYFLIIGLLAISSTHAAEPVVRTVAASDVYTVTDLIHFNEGSVAWKHGILLTNFGLTELNPLNREGKGYVLSLTKDGVNVLIRANGALNAPKGMAITKNNYLFIADVGCVMGYSLKQLQGDGPSILESVDIPLPAGEQYVNDIVALDNLLLVSVTNTGHIYAIDVSELNGSSPVQPRLAASVPGANGLAEHEGTLYIAGYNPDGEPRSEHVIYSVDLTVAGSQPVNLLGERPGAYDGLAVSSDGFRLFFTNWKNAEGKPEVGYIDLREGKNRAVTILDLGVELKGPADICLSEDGYLYIPDLPANILYIVAVSAYCPNE